MGRKRKWKHGRRYLFVSLDGREIWMTQPHAFFPTLTVECRDGFHITWTYNSKDGQAVRPPGNGWSQCVEQSQPGSTEWRRVA
jgi:hypothetical protein